MWGSSLSYLDIIDDILFLNEHFVFAIHEIKIELENKFFLFSFITNICLEMCQSLPVVHQYLFSWYSTAEQRNFICISSWLEYFVLQPPLQFCYMTNQ